MRQRLQGVLQVYLRRKSVDHHTPAVKLGGEVLALAPVC